MPELILEVLENIVAEFGCSRKKCHPKMKEIIKNSADLSKFMLSGKMPLNATLKYFSRADSIALWDEYFVVIVKVFSVDRYIFNKHCFLYNFILIKPLLNAISQSKGVLEIHESLQNSENNIVLEELLERDKQKVVFFKKLCPNYFDKMITKCFFEKIRAAYKFKENSSCFDILSIPASCHEINSNFAKVRISRNINIFHFSF
uniref:Uncharacterized protein n=1 Tax=Panagrolaimus superbus TaxID=310955 RepID=A0A914YAM5_9BILA